MNLMLGDNTAMQWLFYPTPIGALSSGDKTTWPNAEFISCTLLSCLAIPSEYLKVKEKETIP